MLKMILFLSAGILAQAKVIYEYPTQFTDSKGKPRLYMQINLKDTTIIQHKLFSITVPKSWSFNPAGPTKNQLASVDITPTQNIISDQARVTLQLKSKASTLSLENRKKQFLEGGVVKARFVSWNNQKWLLLEQSLKAATAGGDSDVAIWKAFSVLNGRDVIINARVPLKQAAALSPVINKIISSIQLKTSK